MFKYLSLVIFFNLLFLKADPFSTTFGFEMGQGKETFRNISKDKEPDAGKNDFKLGLVPSPSELFKDYYGSIAKKGGLYSLEAVTAPIKTRKTGDEMRKKFESVRAELTELFGPGVMFDGLVKGSKAKVPKSGGKDLEWTQTILSEDREYSFTWTALNGSKLPKNVDEITLYVAMDNATEGTVNLLITFQNEEACELEGLM